MFTAPANTLHKQIYWKTIEESKIFKKGKEKENQTKNTSIASKRNYCVFSRNTLQFYLQVNGFFFYFHMT